MISYILFSLICVHFYHGVVQAQTTAGAPSTTDPSQICIGSCRMPGLTKCVLKPSSPTGFECVPPDTDAPVVPTPAPLKKCEGENDCADGAGPGCLCKSDGTCSPGLACQALSGRCYSCPVGQKDCVCAGGAQPCTAGEGLFCDLTTNTCQPDATATKGNEGQPCRPKTETPDTQCNRIDLYCDEASNTCKLCTSGLGRKQLGCDCTDSNQCLSGLTCNLASRRCAPCLEGCMCMRGQEVMNTVAAQLVCPQFDCFNCRSEQNQGRCKWCNRGGDRNCVATDTLCPSLFAKGDDRIQCGGVLKAKKLRKLVNKQCGILTCSGCAGNPACKFCNQAGDWECIAISEDCPAGGAGTADVSMCANPVCKPADCSGHGTCIFDTFETSTGTLTGRPTCKCNAGYKVHDDLGCVKLNIIMNSDLDVGPKGSSTWIVGLLVSLLVYCGCVAFAALYLRKRAQRTVIVADVSNASSELQVKDDGTVETGDGKQAFKCMEPGCPKAYFTQEDLDKHIQLRHGGGGGGGDFDYNGGTFNNGATFNGMPAGQDMGGFMDANSGIYDNQQW